MQSDGPMERPGSSLDSWTFVLKNFSFLAELPLQGREGVGHIIHLESICFGRHVSDSHHVAASRETNA